MCKICMCFNFLLRSSGEGERYEDRAVSLPEVLRRHVEARVLGGLDGRKLEFAFCHVVSGLIGSVEGFFRTLRSGVFSSFVIGGLHLLLERWFSIRLSDRAFPPKVPTQMFQCLKRSCVFQNSPMQHNSRRCDFTEGGTRGCNPKCCFCAAWTPGSVWDALAGL